MGQSPPVMACCYQRDEEDGATDGVTKYFNRKELFGRSRALLFIKPHAMTDQVKALVKENLQSHLIQTTRVGEMMGSVLDSTGVIDRHFGPIAAKAVRLQPNELTVRPKKQEEFLRRFGVSWNSALEQGLVANANTAIHILGLSEEEFVKRYDQVCRDTEEVKFGHGFYCGKIDHLFVINGFYLKMRAKFTAPDASVLKLEVSWQTSGMSWADFRTQLIGDTDPAAAVKGSLRNLIFSDWRNLGLTSEPDMNDNAIHISAGAFESLVERANWLNTVLLCDPLAKVLQARSSVPPGTLEAWALDPGVLFENQRKSVFDLFMDKNANDVVELAAKLMVENRIPPGKVEIVLPESASRKRFP